MSARLLRIQDWEALAKQADFEPAKMAALCPISLRQLERFFAEHFHKTPENWILELKCRLARKLITTGYSSKAAATELRFSDDAHFCNLFKRIHGVTPQSFAPIFGSRSQNVA
jgi:AraC-like DNA-binding protein